MINYYYYYEDLDLERHCDIYNVISYGIVDIHMVFRIYGRVFRLDFKKDLNFKSNNEEKLEMDMKLLVKENKVSFLFNFKVYY